MTKYFFVSLAVFAVVLFAFEANAGIFQFSETDPKYSQALSIAAAQEAQEDVDVGKKLELDEDLKPEDFGLKDVGILPTSPFYFVKGIRRGVGSLFTTDPAKKAELKLQYAAEKLLEAKEVAQKEGTSDKDKENAIENFKDELEEVKHRVDIASERLNDEQSKELSRKVLDSTLKYGKSLGNIEKNVSPELFLHVKGAKDAASEALASTFGLTEPEIVSNQIAEVLDKQSGSEFKDFKNLEVLKEVEAKVPEKAKEAIRVAQDNALNKLQTELEKFESAKRAIFEEFVKSSGGSEIRHLEIINDLEARPISKDLRDVILGAKEQVFSKAESRLNGLSQENKERFVEHLGEGNLEDFRILRELQNNIDSGVISGISAVASRAEAGFVKKIESTGQDEAQRKEFLGSIERFHDVQSISVLNEIEKLIPDDKKIFFGELKSKAVQEIKNDIGRAANSSQKQSVFDSLAGDHPGDFAALDKFRGNADTLFDIRSFIEGIKSAQSRIMQDRIEKISDKDRLAKYEKEFKQEIPDYALFRKFFEQQKIIFESPEKALKKIEEAENALAEFKGIRSSLSYDSAYKGGEFDQILRDIESILAHAERKLDTARTVLGYNDIGRAFGEAQSALNMAKDGIALATKYKSGVKETKCPFYYSPSVHFCENGVVVHQNDQNGCPLPPRCESKEQKECPVFDIMQCPIGTHREVTKNERGCYIPGKCVEDKITCQAYFEGYIYDKSANTCKKQNASGCTDPFIYHTLEECTKAKDQITICPTLPTVTSCPTGEHKIVTYSSKECGIYYGCEKDITITTPQCSDGKDNDSDGQVDYPADTSCYGKEDYDETYGTSGGYCGDKICQSHEYGGLCTQDCVNDTNPNWAAHVWNFTDGTINSMILNRTDSEYLTFIKGIHAQCEKISKSKFAWKPNAGSDTSENWQNFGIPDCSGSAVSYVCGNNVCDPGETYNNCYSDCGGTGGGSCNNDGVCSGNESNYSCPKDCPVSGNGCYGNATETACKTAGCNWFPGDSKTKSYCEPLASGKYCGNGACEFGETSTSCPSDCKGFTGACYSKPSESECKAGGCTWYTNHHDGTHCDDVAHGQSGTGPGCGTYTTSANCEANPACDWLGSSCAPTTTTMTCNNNKICDYNESQTSCPSDCTSTTARCTYYTETTCNADTICAWVSGFGCGSKAQCNDKIDNDKDGVIDMADSGCTDNFDNDESGGTTTVKCSTASACTTYDSCSASGFYWYNGLCRTSKPSDGTCGYSASYCINETECLTNNYYWCRSACYGDKTACPTTTNNCSALGSDWVIVGSYCLNNTKTHYAPLSSAVASSVQSCTGKDAPITGCASAPGSTTMLYEDTSSLCSDGIDNDKDGFIDKADPGCSAFTTTGTTQCSDGKDNDGDGQVDYPADTGCYGKEDNDEAYYPGGGTTCNSNGTCDSNESYTSCPADCGGATGSSCGTYATSATCEANSACDWIGSSCSPVSSSSFCGDHVCGSNESYTSCPADCGGTTTSCVSCPSPGTGCWYEGGSCSTCGTIKCSTTSTTACNNNGVCDSGESTGSCPSDCGSTTSCSTPSTCFDSAKCASSGWYWYNSGCWSLPQTTTSCVTCSSPGTGCWYEGGSCSTCGTIKCSTTSTTHQCSDGTDNDGDGKVDYPADTGCYGADDDSETAPTGGASALQSFWSKLLGF